MEGANIWGILDPPCLKMLRGTVSRNSHQKKTHSLRSCQGSQKAELQYCHVENCHLSIFAVSSMKKVIFKDSHRGGVARERCNIVKRKIHLVPTSWKIMVCLAKELICPQAFLQLKDNPDVTWSTHMWQQDLGYSYCYMMYGNEIIIHMTSEPSVHLKCVRNFDKSQAFFCLCKPLPMQQYDNMLRHRLHLWFD